MTQTNPLIKIGSTVLYSCDQPVLSSVGKEERKQ